ncbi:MAG: FG-GAP-like repeat-containing protein [candidate division FCPU426 bacterium]
MRNSIVRYGMLGAALLLLQSLAWSSDFQKREVEDSVDGPLEICAADLDTDGDMDIIGIVEQTVYWWENDGVGNFIRHTAGTNIKYDDTVSAGDLDGDGDVDIAVGGSRSMWLENDGSENFTHHNMTSEPYPEFAWIKKIRVKDLDLDNDLDVLCSKIYQGDIIKWINNGSGGFVEKNVFVNPKYTYFIDAGDMDNDGDIDVIAGAVDVEDILVLEYDPSLDKYTERVVDSNFIDPTDVVAVDLDQDNDVDILAASEGQDTVAWYENNLSMSFTKHVIATGFDGAQSVLAADMDNDGDLDVVGCAKDSCDIVWWENDGSENITAHVIDDNYGGVIDVITADVDGDGDADVVAPTFGGDRIDWWENNPLFWNQHFSGGSQGAQPAGWYDESDDGGMNAQIAYAATDSLAEVTTVSGQEWGKVLSYSADVNLNLYSTLEVTISAISGGTAKIAVFSQAGGWEEHVCSGSLAAPGTYSFDIPTASGWSGVKNLGVELISEGGNCVVTFDQVRIHREGMPSPTPTPTITPTPTPTPSNAYFENFAGTQGQQPANWMDETDDANFNAEIAYSAVSSLAAVTRTAEGEWGKVLSPVINCNVSVYSYVEVAVASVSVDASWKVGIQEAEGSWTYYNLSGSQTGTGTYKYNYATATGWSGTHAFRVQLTVEGAPGKAVEVDWVRVGGEETVLGAIYIPATPTFSATSTPVPTLTLTPTPEPTAQLAMNTPTPTATPTATPFVAANQVLPYPNPAKGKVFFAYTVPGAGKVTIDIFTLAGERVASVTETVNGGTGQTLRTAWDAVNVAPGVYLCRIVITDAGGQVLMKEKKKVAIIK